MKISIMLLIAVVGTCQGVNAGSAVTRLAIKPNQSVFKAASRKKPLVINSDAEAAKHFSKEALDTLQAKVTFGKETVIVFAWRGSGQDQMNYEIKKSLPQQIVFSYSPGRTRDLRPHVYVYALRADVKWSVN